MVSQHALQVPRPTPRGKVEASGRGGGLQAHTRGGEVEGSGLGGVSRPTPRGEVEGSGWKGVSPGPHPGGLQAHPPPADGYFCGHPTGMHSCFLSDI